MNPQVRGSTPCPPAKDENFKDARHKGRGIMKTSTEDKRIFEKAFGMIGIVQREEAVELASALWEMPSDNRERQKLLRRLAKLIKEGMAVET